MRELYSLVLQQVEASDVEGGGEDDVELAMGIVEGEREAVLYSVLERC